MPQTVAFLLNLALILLVAPRLGIVANRFGRPAVIGELRAGALVGPTLLGGSISNTLFPDQQRRVGGPRIRRRSRARNPTPTTG
jgi:Kef-type K+ transport system membrane component KefB